MNTAVTIAPAAPVRMPVASRLRLYCFHHAGGSANSFAAWPFRLPPAFDVRSVELPNRWAPGGIRAPLRVSDVVADLAHEVAATTPSGSQEIPFAFYGHSLGALVAFELARELRRRGKAGPMALCVASRRAPRCPLRGRPLCDLPEEELVDRLRQMRGTAPLLLANPRWRAVFLPTMRQDLRLSDHYRYREEAPLELPLFAFRGADDPIVTAPEIAAWSEETIGPTTLHTLSGSHFFDTEGLVALHRCLGEELTALLETHADRSGAHFRLPDRHVIGAYDGPSRV